MNKLKVFLRAAAVVLACAGLSFGQQGGTAGVYGAIYDPAGGAHARASLPEAASSRARAMEARREVTLSALLVRMIGTRAPRTTRRARKGRSG